VVNDLCHDMFLKNYGSDKTKVITVDDDKDHFNGLDMNWDETAGLKLISIVMTPVFDFTRTCVIK